MDQNGENYPDLVIYVADATNLERQLLLSHSIIDLKIPMIFVLNMIDILDEQNQIAEPIHLAEYLQVPVIPISGRNEINIDKLKSKIQEFVSLEGKGFISENTCTLFRKM